MTALSSYNDAVIVIQALWNAQQQARAEYGRYREIFRRTRSLAEKQVAAEQYALHQALVQAAAVRLTTAWEVFLYELLREYLGRRQPP